MNIERQVQQRSMFGVPPVAYVPPGPGREDLRHRAGLLVRRAARGRLGELRLGVGVRVALLLPGAQAAVVALADGLDGGLQREDGELALALRTAAAAGVVQPEAAGPLAAVARVLTRGERRGPVVAAGEAGRRLRPVVELGLHRHGADPVLLQLRARCRGRSASRRTAARRRRTTCASNRARTLARRASSPTPRSPCPPWRSPCRRGRTARARSRRRCRASPGPCPVRSTLPEPSGQPSPSTSSRGRRPAGRAWRSRTSRRGSASSPVQRHTSATMLGNLIVSSVLKSLPPVGVDGVVAEPDRAVRDRLVDDDAGAVVEHLGDVAQRAQVVLDRRRTGRARPPRRPCTRRPWRRSTGSRGSRRRSSGRGATVPSGAGNCLPWFVQRICRSSRAG